MAETVCYVYIFHLTWLMSLHYLVKSGCSKFLPNTGFVTIKLLRFGIKVNRAYCRDNFLSCSEATARHVQVVQRRFFMFLETIFYVSTGPRHIGTWHRRFPGTRERDARNAPSSKRLCPCTRGTFQARILTILSPSVMTTNNSAK